MIIEDGLSEEFCIDVGINLGGENGFVTEHFLNGTKVGSHFDEVGGKGVAEGVGTNGFVDACFGGEVFDDVKNHNPAQTGTPAIEKEDVFIFRRNGGQVPADGIEVKVDVKYGSAANGYESFFVVFANDP